MKKSIILSILALASFSAYADYNGTGYYRVKNYKTDRWISVTDNKGSIDYGSTSADVEAIRLRRNYDVVQSDPASVLYMYAVGSQYQIETQGTGIHNIINYYLNLRKSNKVADGQLYFAYGTKSGLDKYLGDGWFTQRGDNGKCVTNADGDYRKWLIEPITDDGDNFFGVCPQKMVTYHKYNPTYDTDWVENNGKYYTTMYGSFPFSTYSPGVKAFYLKGVHGDMALLQELTGTVAANTPVVFECSTPDAETNRLHIGGTADTVKDNKLTGVYFCFTDENIPNHLNYVKYDPATMRVLGVCKDGSLGFITASGLDYIPANSAYLKVASGTPSEIRIVNEDEYLSGVDEIIGEDCALKTVYNLQGVKVLDRATSEQVEALPKGIYIVNGKKVMVR